MPGDTHENWIGIAFHYRYTSIKFNRSPRNRSYLSQKREITIIHLQKHI